MSKIIRDNRRTRRLNLMQQLEAERERANQLEIRFAETQRQLAHSKNELAEIERASTTEIFIAGVNYIDPINQILGHIQNDIAVFMAAALITNARPMQEMLRAAIATLLGHLNNLDLELKRLAADEVLELDRIHFEDLAAKCMQLRDHAARVITYPDNETVLAEYKDFIAATNPGLKTLILQSRYSNRDDDTIQMAQHYRNLIDKGIGANEAARKVGEIYNRTPSAVKKAAKRTGLNKPIRAELAQGGDTLSVPT